MKMKVRRIDVTGTFPLLKAIHGWTLQNVVIEEPSGKKVSYKQTEFDFRRPHLLRQCPRHVGRPRQRFRATESRAKFRQADESGCRRGRWLVLRLHMFFDSRQCMAARQK